MLSWYQIEHKWYKSTFFFVCRKYVFGLPKTLFRYEQAKNTYKTDVDHVNELRIFKTIRSIYLGQLTSNKNLQNKFLRRQNSIIVKL